MNFQLPGAIFFDMDDTILAYEAVAEKCWREVCHRFVQRIDGLEEDNLLASVIKSAEWFWSDEERARRGRFNMIAARREIVARAFAGLGVNAGGASNEIADRFSAIREEATELIPGAIDTLRRLRSTGVRLALITNGSSRPQRAKIDRFGLEPFFENILIEGEFGVGKPHQRVYQHSLDRLDSHPSETWMVGDNLHADIGGAQSMGIYSVWVNWAGKALPADSPVRPDRVIRAITELAPRR